MPVRCAIEGGIGRRGFTSARNDPSRSPPRYFTAPISVIASSTGSPRRLEVDDAERDLGERHAELERGLDRFGQHGLALRREGPNGRRGYRTDVRAPATGTARRGRRASVAVRVERVARQQRQELLHRQVALLDVRRHGRGDADRRRRRAARARRPTPPVSATTRMPCARACSAARTTFAELPLVEIAISTSPLAAERLDLAREHPLDAEVVRDRGEQRGIGGEGDRRDRRTRVVDREGAHELGGQVLGIGRAAAVAADQQLPAASECSDAIRIRGRGDVVEALGLDERNVSAVSRRYAPARARGRPSSLGLLVDERGDDSRGGREVGDDVVGETSRSARRVPRAP